MHIEYAYRRCILDMHIRQEYRLCRIGYPSCMSDKHIRSGNMTIVCRQDQHGNMAPPLTPVAWKRFHPRPLPTQGNPLQKARTSWAQMPSSTAASSSDAPLIVRPAPTASVVSGVAYQGDTNPTEPAFSPVSDLSEVSSGCQLSDDVEAEPYIHSVLATGVFH